MDKKKEHRENIARLIQEGKIKKTQPQITGIKCIGCGVSLTMSDVFYNKDICPSCKAIADES